MSLPLSKLSPVVKESFVQIGDIIEIFPTFSKKRSLRLTRTKLRVEEKLGGEPEIDSLRLVLPVVDGEFSKYEILYEKIGDLEVFRLRLICGKAFKINGKFSSDVYLQYGDQIILGHNKLFFPLPKASEVGQSFSFTDDLNILIEGETGTGKSTLAKSIHERSGRIGNFVHINVSAFPSTLVESELFGHVKGAFTGAFADKLGAFDLTRDGTLFIDEIDSLTLEMQVKLLLFLDSKKFRPVGSVYEKKSNARLIFASCSKLESLVTCGKMRKDFFYRVSCGHKIIIKPLREDLKKIDAILDDFAIKYNVQISHKLRCFCKEADWPGNIRQLLGFLNKKRVTSLSTFLCVCDDDFNFGQGFLSLPVNEIISFAEIKRNYFKRVVLMCDGDIKVAAKKIGVSENTVRKNSASLLELIKN